MRTAWLNAKRSPQKMAQFLDLLRQTRKRPSHVSRTMKTGKPCGLMAVVLSTQHSKIDKTQLNLRLKR